MTEAVQMPSSDEIDRKAQEALRAENTMAGLREQQAMVQQGAALGRSHPFNDGVADMAAIAYERSKADERDARQLRAGALEAAIRARKDADNAEDIVRDAAIFEKFLRSTA